MAEIGRLLRLARAKRGMTRRQLAAESGASERYLAQIEGGQGNPSVIILRSIAQALEVPIIELLPRGKRRTRRGDDPHPRSARAHAGIRAAGVAELIAQRVGRAAADERRAASR